MPKKGTHDWVITYSAFYGDPPKPVHFSNDKAELEKWLDAHKAQYATGMTAIVPGHDFEHDLAPVDDA